jgi:hypothetical protein
MTTRRTTTRTSGGDACYYSNETCEGETWECGTCGEHYCQAHSHVTSKGHNRECVACERERKDAELLDADDGVERAVVKTDVLDKLDIPDK